MSSVGQPQELALLSHILLTSGTPILPGKILHGVALGGEIVRFAGHVLVGTWTSLLSQPT
jgi:hypothetical protein